MGIGKQEHNRRSIRLKGYDYSTPGEYFITICTHNRKCLFGEVVNGTVQLNRFGAIARDEWQRTETLRDRVVLDAFVIMPNHMHALLGITSVPGNQPNNDSRTVGAYGHTPLRDGGNASTSGHTPLREIDSTSSTESKHSFRSPSKTVGAIVRGYKSTVTRQINRVRNTPGEKVWQRNYYEHIIRDEQSLERIREYIIHNPARWEQDRNHPDNIDP